MTLRVNDNGIDRDMTEAEQAAYDEWAATVKAQNAADKKAELNTAKARASALAKLAALGLTADEIAALVGA